MVLGPFELPYRPLSDNCGDLPHPSKRHLGISRLGMRGGYFNVLARLVMTHSTPNVFLTLPTKARRKTNQVTLRQHAPTFDSSCSAPLLLDRANDLCCTLTSAHTASEQSYHVHMAAHLLLFRALSTPHRHRRFVNVRWHTRVKSTETRGSLGPQVCFTLEGCS